MSATGNGGGQGSAGGSEDRSNTIWNLLPSFAPMTDDPREYKDKVLFLHQICPLKDKPMLAPRLAMMCKRTAWSQVKMLDAEKLIDPVTGVSALLTALATWDEAASSRPMRSVRKRF